MLARGARTSPWKRASTRSSFIPWELRHLASTVGFMLEENSEKLDGKKKHGVVSIFSGVGCFTFTSSNSDIHQNLQTDPCLILRPPRNGVKVTILLEELVEAFPDFEYDAWLIPINGVQFTSGFNAVNPNSKIPAMLDYSDPAKPVRVFESGSILLYLCDQFDKEGKFFPREYPARAECQNWLMWQMGSAPFIGGGFGHFYHYAPLKRLVLTCFLEIVPIFAASFTGTIFLRGPQEFPRKNPGNSPFYNRGLSMPSTDMLWRPNGWWMYWISIWETATSSTSAVTSVAAKSVELPLESSGMVASSYDIVIYCIIST